MIFQALKRITFLSYSTMIIYLLSLFTLKTVHNSNLLDTQISCIQELQEQLQIMLQLGNIVWGFFLKKTSAVCVDNILLRQDIISFTSVGGLITIGIQIKSLSITSLPLSSLIQEFFFLWKDYLIAVSLLFF